MNLAVWTPELLESVRAAAAAAGFDLANVAAAPAAENPDGRLTADRFAEWIDLGRAGEMEYLKRRDQAGDLLRQSARTAIPWARSVLVCAYSYHAEAPRSVDPAPAGTGWIARYAWQGTPAGAPADYHDHLLARLHVVEAALQSEAKPCQTRCYVDTGPLLERDFATRAGVGWTGKNTCILNQEMGSWLLLGVIVTSLELPRAVTALPAPDRCGSCTRCLDACPTNALIAPRQMDAALCIAYLTIEKKGEIPEHLRAPMGRQVFGCDICQDVCPWNRRAPVIERLDLQPRLELVNPALSWLAGLSPPEFKQSFKGSPLERTKQKRIARNVAVAMGNSGLPEFLPRLTAWTIGEDPVLAETAHWAIDRIIALSSASMDGSADERSFQSGPHG